MYPLLRTRFTVQIQDRRDLRPRFILYLIIKYSDGITDHQWEHHILNSTCFRPHYENFLSFKIENFQLKSFDIFLIFAQNIDCGYTLEPPRRGGSNEYPQSMFWSKNKKNRYTPAYPSPFAIQKWGLRGYIARTCFPDGLANVSGNSMSY